MLDPKLLFLIAPAQIRERGDEIIVEWQIPETFPYFEGHFPGNPVFPAVAVIDGTCEFLVQAQRCDGIVTKIKKAKFSGVLGPREKVSVHLSPGGEKTWEARWEVSKNDGSTAVMAELTIVF